MHTLPSANASSPEAHEVKSFCDQVIDKLEWNIDGKEFLPADRIELFTSREIITAELQNKTGSVSLDSLVDYTLTKPAVKLFLTLACAERLDAMAHFAQIGLCDKDLPLDELVSEGITVLKSLSPTSTSNSIWTVPPGWKGKARHAFLVWQWKFLAPVFTQDKFAHVFFNRCPLPIIKKEHGSYGGLSSSVSKVEIEEAHQRVFLRVRVAHPYSPHAKHAHGTTTDYHVNSKVGGELKLL